MRASLALSALVALAGCTTDFSLDQLSTDATVAAEASTDAGPGACGASGQPCCPASTADAGGTCASSLVCNGESCVACPEGLAACGGRCVDLRVSPVHCGACGVACPDGEQCVGGGCELVCPAGLTNCGGRCVRLADDPTHCAGCGVSCAPPSNAATVCEQGRCGAGPCFAGYGDCDNNPANGCETNLATTAAHCGACGRACATPNATPTCAGGACAPGECLAGFADCDRDPANGCEIDTRVNAANCGGCGMACSGGRVCAAGACATAPTGCEPRVRCVAGGPCVDTATDVNNCGACGRSCGFANATPRCESGACALGACNTGFANCDGAPMNGCEANTATSLNHCGGCAQRCDGVQNAARVCQGGRCDYTACDMGFGDCDNDRANGCEANLRASVAHCGGCGRACALAHATPRCDGGACRVQSCEAGWANCDGNDANGCEVNVRASNTNCGGCGRVCGFIIPGLFAACCNGSCATRASCN